jgi:enterochelin esterase family protein
MTPQLALKNPQISGRSASLFWQGQNAPHVISDQQDWGANPQPMDPAGPDLWHFEFDLDEDIYLEYAFYDPISQTRFADPLNPKKVFNGIDAYNHYFYMPGAKPNPLTRTPSGGLRGAVARYTVPAEFLTVSKTRRVFLYQPAVREAVPLLMVYDGMDYFKRGKLTEIVDHLITQKRIRPLALAFLQNAGQARMVEYACAETTLAFLMNTVLPLAAHEMKLIDTEKQPGAHGVLGASMGGLMSVYTALRLPQVFGQALSQAGAFKLWDQETIAMQWVRHAPRTNIKLWLDCGKLDFLRACNREMSQLMSAKGYNIRYHETGGAHNYTTWRNHLTAGLETLFGDV